jgi:hypothetical protein
LADTQIVGDAGERQVPATHVANPVDDSRRNGRFTRSSNGAASNGNGSPNGHSNGSADLPADLADWIHWNVSPYWSQLLDGSGAQNGHANGGDPGSGSRPARKGMALEGITPTGLARRLGR